MHVLSVFYWSSRDAQKRRINVILMDTTQYVLPNVEPDTELGVFSRTLSNAKSEASAETAIRVRQCAKHDVMSGR